MSRILSQDYVLLEIDTERHVGGADLASRLRGERAGGIPWIAIVDAEGKELITSDAPGGNIGCPVSPPERAWFLEMVDRTRQYMAPEDRSLLETEHVEWSRKHQR